MAIVDVTRAAKELGISKSFIYHLPPGTPGVLRFGRALRVDVDKFCEWAAQNQQGKDGHEE